MGVKKNNNFDIENALRHADQDQVMSALEALAAEYEHEPEMLAEIIRLMTGGLQEIEQELERTHVPVSVDEFLDSDYFLGIGDEIFPEVRVAAKAIIEGGKIEALLMGAIGIGKTTLAQIVQAYHLYDLSTLVNPQAKFGLMATSSIVIAMINRTDQLAQAVTFGEFRQLIENVPYFKEKFPFPSDQKSKMDFPNNIKVIPSAAYSKNLLGMNVIGGIIDEMNFMSVIEKSKQSRDGAEFNQAVEIYNTLVRRRKSRFDVAGKLPGCLCVVSSKGGPDDFTEKRKRAIEQEDDQLAYVWDKKQWEVRPRHLFAKEEFLVEVGDERHASRIIPDETVARSGSTIIHVPMNLKKDFEGDMEGALRDLAGTSTLVRKPFFYDRDKIWLMGDNFEKKGLHCPFEILESDLSDGLPRVIPGFKPDHPDRMRVVHVDLGLANDACGISCGYVHSIQTHRIRDAAGNMVVEDFPVVAYDAVFRVVQQSGREIDFDEIRNIIYLLRDTAGIPIRIVTYDGFQSVDSRQLLAKKGFASGYMSVDGKDGREIYRSFRQAVFNERVYAPEHHHGFVELSRLEEDHKKKLVDHPLNGSKDVADSMAGVFATLMKHRASWAGMAFERPRGNERPRSHSRERPQGISRPQHIARPSGDPK